MDDYDSMPALVALPGLQGLALEIRLIARGLDEKAIASAPGMEPVTSRSGPAPETRARLGLRTGG